MKRMKFGDLEPGTIWKLDGDDEWWLKVDAQYVYSDCRAAPSGDRGWSIQVGGTGVKDLSGRLYWTRNSSEVIVWDGTEELK